MNPTKSSVVRVEFDNATRVIQFFIGTGGPPVGEWDLREELGKDPEDLERRIGYALLGVLSADAGESVGNRDYLADRNSRTTLILESLRKRLDAGDKSAIVSIVLELIASARRNRDVQEIGRAEKLLREAANGGNEAAKEFLVNSWEIEKRAAIAHIEGA
jgi:hypothetical protein